MTPALKRRADHPRRGGDRHPGLCPAPDQPGHRLHPGRHPGRAVRPRRADRSLSRGSIDHDHRPRSDRAVRRVRHRPAAVLDRAGAQLPPLVAMRKHGVRHRRGGAARLPPLLIGGALVAVRHERGARALWLSLALAMSSTALVLPHLRHARARSGERRWRCCCSRTWRWCRCSSCRRRRAGGAAGLGASSPLAGRAGDRRRCWSSAASSCPRLFAQAARTKKPELFLAISLLVVILSATVTASRRPVADHRRAGRRPADRRDRISQRSRGDHRAVQGPRARRLPDHRRHADRPGALIAQLADRCSARWPAVLLVKAVVTGVLLRMAGARQGVAARNRGPDGMPVRNHPDRAGRRRAGGLILSAETVGFWQRRPRSA